MILIWASAENILASPSRGEKQIVKSAILNNRDDEDMRLQISFVTLLKEGQYDCVFGTYIDE